MDDGRGDVSWSALKVVGEPEAPSRQTGDSSLLRSGRKDPRLHRAPPDIHKKYLRPSRSPMEQAVHRDDDST
ncbi:hypothetical protein D3C72_2238220 [compost metagenome]